MFWGVCRGDVYQGSWDNNLPHGQGLLTRLSGSSYKGAFNRGAISEKGTSHRGASCNAAQSAASAKVCPHKARCPKKSAPAQKVLPPSRSVVRAAGGSTPPTEAAASATSMLTVAVSRPTLFAHELGSDLLSALQPGGYAPREVADLLPPPFEHHPADTGLWDAAESMQQQQEAVMRWLNDRITRNLHRQIDEFCDWWFKCEGVQKWESERVARRRQSGQRMTDRLVRCVLRAL